MRLFVFAKVPIPLLNQKSFLIAEIKLSHVLGRSWGMCSFKSSGSALYHVSVMKCGASDAEEP